MVNSTDTAVEPSCQQGRWVTGRQFRVSAIKGIGSMDLREEGIVFSNNV